MSHAARRPVGMRTAGEVAEALDLERIVAGTRMVQMVKRGELKMAARRYKAAYWLAVPAAGTIVRLPTARRWA